MLAVIDFNMILTGIVGLATAIGGGAVGNVAGRAWGDKPWQKVLAPAGSIALATIYKGVTGDDNTAATIAAGGVKLGIFGSGVFSIIKNGGEFLGLFKKKVK